MSDAFRSWIFAGMTLAFVRAIAIEREEEQERETQAVAEAVPANIG
jgi:hypothetical protein